MTKSTFNFETSNFYPGYNPEILPATYEYYYDKKINIEDNDIPFLDTKILTRKNDEKDTFFFSDSIDDPYFRDYWEVWGDNVLLWAGNLGNSYYKLSTFGNTDCLTHGYYGVNRWPQPWRATYYAPTPGYETLTDAVYVDSTKLVPLTWHYYWNNNGMWIQRRRIDTPSDTDIIWFDIGTLYGNRYTYEPTPPSYYPTTLRITRNLTFGPENIGSTLLATSRNSSNAIVVKFANKKDTTLSDKYAVVFNGRGAVNAESEVTGYVDFPIYNYSATLHLMGTGMTAEDPPVPYWYWGYELYPPVTPNGGYARVYSYRSKPTSVDLKFLIEVSRNEMFSNKKNNNSII